MVKLEEQPLKRVLAVPGEIIKSIERNRLELEQAARQARIQSTIMEAEEAKKPGSDYYIG